MVGTCLLCLTIDQELQRSHYVSDAVLKHIGLNIQSVPVSGVGPHAANGQHDNVRNSSEPSSWGVPLFCRTCERHFSINYEGDFLSRVFCVHKAVIAPPFAGVRWSSNDRSEVDRIKLQSTLISLLWRTVLVAWFDVNEETQKWLLPWLLKAREDLLSKQFRDNGNMHVHFFIDDLQCYGTPSISENEMPETNMWCIGEIEFRTRNVGYMCSNYGPHSGDLLSSENKFYGIQVGRFWIVLCNSSDLAGNCSSGQTATSKLCNSNNDNVDLQSYVGLPRSLYVLLMTKMYSTYYGILNDMAISKEENVLDNKLQDWINNEGLSDELREWINEGIDFRAISDDQVEENLTVYQSSTHDTKYERIFDVTTTVQLQPGQQDALHSIVDDRKQVQYNDAPFRRSIGVYIISLYLRLRKQHLRSLAVPQVESNNTV